MEPLASPVADAQVHVDCVLADGGERTLAEDVLDGLTRPFKELPPKHFYDARGSQLFDEICCLPEYYPTRTERGILNESALEIIEGTGAEELVELGSGSADKTRVLLEAMISLCGHVTYIPIDVSEEALRESAARLVIEYPGLRVHGVVGDFERHLDRLPAPRGPRTICFLGGTIGNFPPGSRRRFLRSIGSELGPDGHLLLGVDLVKEPRVIEAAYDDSAGVTAEFNRNVLHVINRELGADFDPDAFDHVAFFDAECEWIEMRLRARRRQVVRIPAVDLTVSFAAREELRTEISAKFTRKRVERDFLAAGLQLTGWYTDPENAFALALGRQR